MKKLVKKYYQVVVVCVVMLDLESSRFKREIERGKKKACFSLRACLSSRARARSLDCEWSLDKIPRESETTFFFDFWFLLCAHFVECRRQVMREQERRLVFAMKARRIKIVIFYTHHHAHGLIVTITLLLLLLLLLHLYSRAVLKTRDRVTPSVQWATKDKETPWNTHTSL